ncbi:hypothetical protein [Nucisporomicrobium flavum]|jgi:hypothetical protein|uniref:hypothetical protein n=1 Tax=Nucisporomicrobium flavum TaxID=2785915 RepID=UPI0018F2A001|nr:hypothetical protein [Nucisporomicrobium flavum]
MQLVVLRLSALSGAGDPAGAAVADVVWAHTRRRERLEHLHVRIRPAGIDLVLFFVLADRQTAVSAATGILRRTIRSSAVLRQYRIEP